MECKYILSFIPILYAVHRVLDIRQSLNSGRYLLSGL